MSSIIGNVNFFLCLVVRVYNKHIVILLLVIVFFCIRFLVAVYKSLYPISQHLSTILLSNQLTDCFKKLGINIGAK